MNMAREIVHEYCIGLHHGLKLRLILSRRDDMPFKPVPKPKEKSCLALLYSVMEIVFSVWKLPYVNTAVACSRLPVGRDKQNCGGREKKPSELGW